MKSVPDSSRLALKVFLAIAVLMPGFAYGELLAGGENEQGLLPQIAEALDALQIDVLPNLNHRELVRGRHARPRLGGFPDIPLNALPTTQELLQWEQAFELQEIGGLAILLQPSAMSSDSEETLLQSWLNRKVPERLFVTFAMEDLETAEKIAEVAQAYGHDVAVFRGSNEQLAGNYYSTAARRLAIDSQAARRLDVDVKEVEYLGERVRRNSTSIFRDSTPAGGRNLARAEPSIFLKESLGDEFSESTVREIVVPGGVAFGETARLPEEIEEMQFIAGELRLTAQSGAQWRLPEQEPAVLKALFDFAARSAQIDSDAIVDIDADGRVRISSALRDTDVGYQLMHADTQPFEYVQNLRVTKSVIIDTNVAWEAQNEDALGFSTEIEVRFLSADNMRLAQTRAALVYGYDGQNQQIEHIENWGLESDRLRENLDYDGLGNEMAAIADYAGWLALLRYAQENQVSFLKGRYEFMKIDKQGQQTPARY